MLTFLGKIFATITIGLSGLFGHSQLPQPSVGEIPPILVSTTTTQDIATSSINTPTPVINAPKGNSSTKPSIFQSLKSLITPNTPVATAPVTTTQSSPTSVLPSGDCSPDLFVTPSTLTPSVPDTDTFTVKITDPCGFQGVSFRMNTGDSASEVDGIPQNSIDSSGTTAIFTTTVVADSAHIGDWSIYFTAGSKLQTIYLKVGENPAQLAVEQAAKAAAEAAKVHVTVEPASIAFDGTTTISWTAQTGATSCTLGSSPVLLAPIGSQTTGVLESSTTYTVTCSGVGGSVSGSATVTVQPWVPPAGYKVLPWGECTTATAPCTTGPNDPGCSKDGCGG